MHAQHSTREYLRQLIAFPTVSNRSILDLAAQVANWTRDLGFSVELVGDPQRPDKVNVISRIGPQTGEGIVLCGHMDVVPTEGQPWHSDPFQLSEQDGKLVGRGTADMKGFIAASLSALSNLNLKNLRNEIVLIWTYDEEVGCLGARHLAEHWSIEMAHIPKDMIIGEPTDFNIIRLHAGFLTYRIKIAGKAAHSSQPDLGVSAIKILGKVLSRLEHLEEDLKREKRYEEEFERPYVTLNAGSVQGGKAINIVPDSCELMLGLRPLPRDNVEKITARVQGLLDDVKVPSGGAISLELLNHTPAFFSPAQTALQQTLSPFANHSHKEGAAFATDAGQLSRLGFRPLVFGPGSIEVAHRANEYVEERSLNTCVDILSQVIARRCT